MRFIKGSSAALPLATLAFALAACSSKVSSTSATGAGGSAAQTSTGASPGNTSATGSASTASMSTGSGSGSSTSTASGGLTDFTAGGSRPTTVYVPPGYDPTKPAPLLLLLHGYTASGAIQEAYMQVKPHAMAHGMLYAHPDGTVDGGGNRFWNATDACCNFYGSSVDDSAYLIGLIDEIKSKANIDPKRVYLLGHSNGGFMSYRMACDHAGDIAAIVSLAGATFLDTSKCAPSEAVSVLEIHGDADQTIQYGGGANLGHMYPSVATTLATWVGYDGCSTTADTSQPPRDLDATLAGNESTVSVWGQGCKPGGHVEHWRIVGGGHIPNLSSTFVEQSLDFLLAHPKP